MESFRKRQWRTTLLLLVSLCLLAVGAEAIRRQTQQAVTATAEAEKQTETAIREALKTLREAADTPLAELRSSDQRQQGPKATLIFEGVTEPETMRGVLATLQAQGAESAFYVTALQAGRWQTSLELAHRAGYHVECAAELAANDQEGRVRALCEASVELTQRAGAVPRSLLMEQEPDEATRRLAYACGLEEILCPTAFVEAQQPLTTEEAEALLQSLPRGAILCVRLPEGKVATGRNQAVLQTVEALAKAVTASDLTARAEELCRRNRGKLAEAAIRVHTVERNAAFTFEGLGNEEELHLLLQALEGLKGKALFYITENDLNRNGDSIKSIVQAGHDLGLAMPSHASEDAQVLLERLLRMQERLGEAYGYPNAFVLRQTTDAPSEALREAASAGGMTLLTATTNCVHVEDAETADAQEIFDKLFPAESAKLQRGQILHFRMNLLLQRSDLLSHLVTMIQERQSIYGMASVAAMLQNDSATYVYPVPKASMLPELQSRIAPGQLKGSLITAIQQRYIGAEWVDTRKMLPGFTGEEIRTLDKTGLIRNDDRAVFLTFDDWGTDQTITRLLDVLAAHGVKATFFVRTNNVHYNPNLLRAIAAEGHEIGCHTGEHFALANDISTGGKANNFLSLTEEQAADLREDLLIAWQTLLDTVGDVQIDGTAALSPLFRPPTLAVSKIGLEVVLDCGFRYSVSGSYSSQDYLAKGPKMLARAMSSHTVPGAVIVMHMSDNAVHTAEALDIFLTEKELLTERRRLTFARLGDYLPEPGTEKAP